MNQTPQMTESPEGDTETQEVASGNKESEVKETKFTEAENENDSGEDDMFEADDFEIKAVERVVQRTRRDDRFLNSEVQDSEGYYIPRMGDIIHDRYTVFKNQGRGVFSSVLRVRDAETNNCERVIKVIRNNEVMYKAGIKEIQHLNVSKQ